MSSIPPFTLKQPRYDQSTFTGRLRQICAQLDPLKLLVGSASVDEARSVLEHFKKHGVKPAGKTDAAMWEARELVEARTHPDTGEEIFRPLCFAAYCPMQPPIILGMVWPGAGPLNQAFWQWYNASFNAAVFYANRNASSPVSNSDLGIAYAAAVTSSIGVGAGMVMLGDKMKKRGGALGGAVRAVAPFSGTVCSGVATLLCMRWKELYEGVELTDPTTGAKHGRSVTAARDGLSQCALARVVWNIPIFVLTPMCTGVWRRSSVAAKAPRLVLPVEVLIATACVAIGIYPAQAMFSQQATIHASRLEPEFRDLGVENFVYNKGL